MTYLPTVAILLCLPLVNAQSQSCAVPAPAQTVAAITALNEQYINAARDKDPAWFRTHMAEDVLVVLGNGRRVSKSDFVKMVETTTPANGFRSLVARDVTVRVFGPVAQVDADSHWQRTDATSGVSRYIDTYVWRDCRWQVISAQITPLPQPAGNTEPNDRR